ncbi:hypothetical protein Tco_0052783 [Tanacetum coccineum]
MLWICLVLASAVELVERKGRYAMVMVLVKETRMIVWSGNRRSMVVSINEVMNALDQNEECGGTARSGVRSKMGGGEALWNKASVRSEGGVGRGGVRRQWNVTDFTKLETNVNVSPIPTSRIHSIHPTTQILGDLTSAVLTRRKVNKSYIQKQRRNNHKDFQHCLFACFLSQIEPKKISQALEDES